MFSECDSGSLLMDLQDASRVLPGIPMHLAGLAGAKKWFSPQLTGRCLAGLSKSHIPSCQYPLGVLKGSHLETAAGRIL
jgi:hypothetical protein